MKSKKRVIAIVVLALAGMAIVAMPAAAMRGRGGAGMGRAGGRGMGPAFTEEQLEQIEKIHDKYNDERAELTNRLKVIMVEAQEGLDEGEPDFGAIEKTMEEVADLRLKLSKIRLQIHKEIRPLLDEDQKVLFDRGLGRILRGGHGGRGGHPGMMGGRAGGRMGGRGMCGGPGAMGGGGWAPGQGGQGGWTPGPGAGGTGGMNPWCPFAPDSDDE